MPANETHTRHLGRAFHHWSLFDSLPREAKEFFWYSPLNFAANRPSHANMRQGMMKEQLELICEEAYGKSHPQSRASLQGAKLNLEDMGF